MDDNSALINQFSEICGTDLTQSQFYLEASNFDLDIAVSSFFAEQEDDPTAQEESPFDDPIPPSAQVSTNNQGMPKPTDRIATIASLGRRQNTSSSSDSGDEGQQAFYVGGSEQGGGQEVLGPRRAGGAGSSDIIKGVFQAARDHGAEEVAAEGASARPPTNKKKAFAGSGYRLGENANDDNVLVGQPLPSAPGGGPADGAQPQQIDMVLKMWQNGFSVGDGPLREYSDPTNREFLSTISRGEVPQELLRLNRGGEVNLNMEDHRNEEFREPPKPKAKPFEGTGHILGSPAPAVVMSSPSTVAASPPVVSPIKLDESAPVTQIQVRLGDGSRLVVKLNHSHKVSDIRQHVLSIRPEFLNRNFVLMTTFPNRELKDETQTLANEKLLNAVIVQKFI